MGAMRDTLFWAKKDHRFSRRIPGSPASLSDQNRIYVPGFIKLFKGTGRVKFSVN
jgi:hypothetical protein